MNKNILFITWDGPQTSYMEGLFMPIFHKIRELCPSYRFHIIQFTWGDPSKIKRVADKANDLRIIYNPFLIYRKPFISIGSIITIAKGIRQIKKYIRQHNIDIIMPRATLPAIMVNRLKSSVKLIFDADGLPIEERVDFVGLKRSSFQYKVLKKEENNILKQANAVITRSNKAINIHISNIGKQYKHKFFKVPNGKDTELFKLDETMRNQIRNQLRIQPNEKVFIYAGSLGSQYCLGEMVEIFTKYQEINENSLFMLLTGSISFLLKKIPPSIRENFIIKTIPTEDIPAYMNAADIAFAIRKPTYSTQGVAPIKLSEYLLTGLPTIASRGVGDTDEIIDSISPNCFLYDHTNERRIDDVIKWISSNNLNRNNIALSSKNKFSLEASANSYIKAIQSVK